MATSGFLSIIIPTFNRAGSLARQLGWLEAQSIDRAVSELIVVDDGSSDNTWEILTEKAKTLSWLRPLRQTNQGQAAARQYGVRESRGEILLFLDDDMQPATHDFLECHRQFHLHRPVRSFALGAIHPPPDDPPRPAFEYFYEKSIRGLYEQFTRGTLKPSGTHFFSANVSLSKSLFLESGGFDPAYRHAEDRELGLRLEMRFAAPFAFLYQAAAYHHSPTARYESFVTRARLYGEYDWRMAQLYPQRPEIDPRRMLDAQHPLKRMLALFSWKFPNAVKWGNPWLISLAKRLQTWGLLRWAVLMCSSLYVLNYVSGLRQHLDHMNSSQESDSYAA